MSRYIYSTEGVTRAFFLTTYLFKSRGYAVDIKQMIGVRIAELRTRKGMTQEKLAARMSTSPKWLSSLEHGKENPTLDKLISLAQALDVDLGEIFTFVEVENPRKRKALLEGLLKKADDEQLKLAAKILKAII